MTSAKLKDVYIEFYKLQNKKVREMGYKDVSENWIEDFEDPNFEKNYDDLYEQIKPLYEQLHAYVRRRLKSFYGKHYPPTHNNSLIPVHLLGHMWARDWANIYNLVEPYPNLKKVNLTRILIDKQYTPFEMFKVKIIFFYLIIFIKYYILFN